MKFDRAVHGPPSATALNTSPARLLWAALFTNSSEPLLSDVLGKALQASPGTLKPCSTTASPRQPQGDVWKHCFMFQTLCHRQTWTGIVHVAAVQITQAGQDPWIVPKHVLHAVQAPANWYPPATRPPADRPAGLLALRPTMGQHCCNLPGGGSLQPRCPPDLCLQRCSAPHTWRAAAHQSSTCLRGTHGKHG